METGESNALAVIEHPLPIEYPHPVMDLDTAKKRLAEFQAFVKGYLVEEEDYGKIPGTPKPTLYKSGADKLCELYGFADSYDILSKTEDFDKGLFDYNIECRITSRRDGTLVASGLGSCNSYESRYRFREAKRKCPSCGKEAIFRSKKEGEGWYCWAKKEGCGAQFPTETAAITSQEVGKVLNDDIPSLKNTVLKMAKKRAKIDATLAATRSSGIFTQDLEDTAEEKAEKQRKAGARQPSPTPTAKPTATPQPASQPAQAGDLLTANISEVNDMYASTKEKDENGRPKPGKLYVWVKDGPTKSWPCFNPALFDRLRGLHGETVTLRMAQGPKGAHIVGIVSEADDSLGITDKDLPPVMTEAF